MLDLPVYGAYIYNHPYMEAVLSLFPLLLTMTSKDKS